MRNLAGDKECDTVIRGVAPAITGRSIMFGEDLPYPPETLNLKVVDNERFED